MIPCCTTSQQRQSRKQPSLLALSTGRSAAYQRRELRLIQADVQMQSEVAFTSSSLSRPILKRILSWELASVSGDKRRRRHGRRRSNSELVKQAPVPDEEDACHVTLLTEYAADLARTSPIRRLKLAEGVDGI